MTSLSSFWPIIKGTNDTELVILIGEIMNANGYGHWSVRWLLEKYLFHPTDVKIINLLALISAELLDYNLMKFSGELSLATGSLNLQSIERLLGALLAVGDDKRCHEILNRINNSRKTIKMHELELSMAFYGEENMEKVIQLFNLIPSEKRSSLSITHAALALYQCNDFFSATKILQPLIDKDDPNAIMAMYEVMRQRSPKNALKMINKLYQKHGFAPLNSQWINNKFNLTKMSCGTLKASNDERLISVIMTAHQKNPMMDTAVRSVLEQTHQKIELVIVDDYSSEEDKEYYASILEKDPRVRIIHQEKNKGTYSARNRGLREIKGDFVTFMDSDDWSHPQRIEFGLKRLDENPNCIFTTECYTRLSKLGELTIGGGYFVRRCMLGLWRTEIIRDELGGFDNVRVAADAETFERAQKRYGINSIITLQIPTYFAYSHDRSLTGGGDFSIDWRGVSGKRAAYAGEFRTWHRRLGGEISTYKMNSTNQEPPFRMPVGIQRTEEYSNHPSLVNEKYIGIYNDLRSSIVDALLQPLVPVETDATKPFVTICMATFPQRFHQIGNTVKYLLTQTHPPDEILIHVNESSTPPKLPKDKRIKVHLSPDENLTDIGKIKMVDYAKPGIIILADDDLHYPEDYVETMVNHVQRFNGEACVGTHGIVFPLGKEITDIDQYFSNRRVHHFKHGLSIDLPCHALGTGTMAYDSRKLQYDWKNWKHGKMVDLHVSVENQRKGIQMIIVPRKSNWIQSFSEEPDDISIWKEVKSNIDLQTKMIEVVSSIKSWTFHLSGDIRIAGEDLLRSDPNYNKIENLEIPSDYIRFAGKGGYEPLKKWKQNGRVLYFKSAKRTIQFIMPIGWDIQDTHPDLFQLAHYVLMYPFEKGILDNWNPSRTSGWRPGISFSGGIDSAACLALMPKNTVALYHERQGFPSILNHTNAYQILNELERMGTTVFKIPSDHELIRTDYGKAVGFSSDFSAGVHAILLADFLSLNSLAFGLPLENSYLFHGYKGRDFLTSKYWLTNSELFSSCGLELFYPSAGLSEFINLEIVENESHGHLAQSCLRSDKKGEVCGVCWKCFRKNTMRGGEIVISEEVSKFLGKIPLKQAASTLYALQKLPENEIHAILKKFPHLVDLIELDFGFLGRYHPDSMLFVPEQYRTQYIEKLQAQFSPMDENEVIRLESMNLFE
jgi:glycosyltransferase involved in cell wall biosynthesis